MMYCERIAPQQDERACREVGARAVFEKKIQDEEAQKLYKRAYKKYYARYMKGNMSRENFGSWVQHTAAQRDTVRLLLEGTNNPEKRRAELIEWLRADLNRL